NTDTGYFVRGESKLNKDEPHTHVKYEYVWCLHLFLWKQGNRKVITYPSYKR
ncbi:unnamed protein product, partial [Trichobilharzia szidati]